ncbi:hypothetical protein TCAL_01388 [Tigriopus californicus]|uniref:TOG domain-containing protein n=1 Tax=Tigriopus californicus TaxID=6832 RepID=A0A553NSU6_TIGCA|nr:hypothetical protein TCAL_01388 [Tigriopus californicus]
MFSRGLDEGRGGASSSTNNGIGPTLSAAGTATTSTTMATPLGSLSFPFGSANGLLSGSSNDGGGALPNGLGAIHGGPGGKAGFGLGGGPSLDGATSRATSRAASTTSTHLTHEGVRRKYHSPTGRTRGTLTDPDRFQRQFMDDSSSYYNYYDDIIEDDRASRLSCLNSKYDRLHSIRYKLEHNHIPRANLETKLAIFQTLKSHLESDDSDVTLATLQVISDILPHLGPDIDVCMSVVLSLIVPCLSSDRAQVKKATLNLLQINLKFCCDIQAVLRVIVQQGLDHPDPKVVHETLICLPILFPLDYDTRYGNKNLFLIVSGIGRRLVDPEFQTEAFMSLEKIGEVLGPRQFHTYIDKFTAEQKKTYDQIVANRETAQPSLEAQPLATMGNGVAVIPPDGVGVVGRKLPGQKGWVEYGSIDDAIIEKLKDDEDIRVRLQGAEELNRAVKGMKDMTPLLPQLRLFLNFLDSMLEEQNFKMNLLTLEIYGVLVDRIKGKVKPHLRTVCTSLLKHCSNPRIVVRIENYRVIKKLMLVAKPNPVLNHMFDHIGDKRAIVREAILNIVMFALLTFPSYEFDLKNIAASIVPTLVDPKRRVRQASQECIAILAAFMGPSKATPLIRSIELLETHFEKGTGILAAIHSRLSRRQLPRITPDGLVEYSLHIPTSALRGEIVTASFGPDIDWILAGTGSISSGSAKSVSTQSDPRLDESLSSSNSFPNSPSLRHGTFHSSINGTALQPIASSRSEEYLNIHPISHSRPDSRNKGNSSHHEKRRRSRTDSDLKAEDFAHLPDQIRGGVGSHSGSKVNGFHSNHHEDRRASQNESELPRLTGTKSQASTASSSATRDSGISLSEQQARQKELKTGLTRSSSRAKSKYQQQISVDDLPVNGHAVSLANRRQSINKSLSTEEQQRTVSRLSNKYKSTSKSQERLTNNHQYMADDEDDDVNLEASTRTLSPRLKGSKSENHINAISPPRSPKYPNPKGSQHALLMRPADNSPFSSRMLPKRTGSQISTPYSQVSVPSSYEYEDDFTSDESIIENNSVIDNKQTTPSDNKSAASSRTVTSTTSSCSLSKIPIQRNSSLRRKKTVMNQYQALPPSVSNPNLGQGTYFFDENAPLSSLQSSKMPSLFNDQNFDQDSIPPGYSPMASVVSNKRTKKSSNPNQGPTHKTSKTGGRGVRAIRARPTKPRAPLPPQSSKMNGTQSKSVGSDLNQLNDPDPDLRPDQVEEAFKKSSLVPLTPPEKDRISAGSNRDIRNHHQDPVQVPEELTVYEPPDVGLEAAPLTADMSLPPPDRSVLSTAQSTISNSNYQHLQLKTVITLKSPFEGSNLGPAPVSRAAAVTLTELLRSLKRNLESDMDKIIVPLIHKTGDTNKFLREDCHVALDAIIENLPNTKVLSVITADPVLNHKNPVIRGTVARLLAYITDRITVPKALGTREITEKLVPSIAKLCQDGSQDARNFAKLTLVMFMDQQPDYEKILKKNVTPNTMRNLEKIMDALRQNQNGPTQAGRSGNRLPKRNSRKTL